MSEKNFEYHRAKWESIPRFELAWVHTDTPAIDYFDYLEIEAQLPKLQQLLKGQV